MIDNLLNSTIVIQSPTSVKGSSGAEKVTWVNTVTNLACRVIDATPKWQILYEQRKLICTHQVYFNIGPVVKIGYQLLWQGRTLRVIGVKDLGGARRITQVDVQELQI